MILPENNHFQDIALIGMAGAGKSTVGLLLADSLDYDFIDTDDLIAAAAGTSLQHVLDRHGRQHFQMLEEEILLSIAVDHSVIATGGSAVYSRAGMKHLQAIALVVWLDVPLPVLEMRVNNLQSRGLVNPDGTSFSRLYQQRFNLYQRYAHIRIQCRDKGVPQIVSEITAQVKKRGRGFPGMNISDIP